MKTRCASSSPRICRARIADFESASIERSSGIFASSASPVHDANAVGMQSRRAVRVLEDERGAGRVPGGVAARLEGGADAAGRERRGVGLALDQLLAGEVGDRAALAVGLEERVVLLRGEARQGLEDVRVVGGAALQRPLLHRLGDLVGEVGVERLAGGEHRLQLLVRVLREAVLLHRGREDVGAERVVRLLGQVDGAERLAVGAPLRGGQRSAAGSSSSVCKSSYRAKVPHPGGTRAWSGLRVRFEPRGASDRPLCPEVQI